ncbi:MAG: hypothetical protein AABY93_04095 [Bacteroidota bacterium]
MYSVLNNLSIDVALGTIICATFFSHILHVQPSPVELASLGITVWIIYTVDHLLDVRKLKHEASSLRHRFHQKNFSRLSIALMLSIAVDFLLILLLRRPVVYWGIGLTLLVVVYLFFQQKLIAIKEIVISILYAAGVLLPSISMREEFLSMNEILLVLFFWLIALNNLFLFSWYEWKQDIRDSHQSFVTFFGRNPTRIILVVLFGLQIALFIELMTISLYRKEAAILELMNLILVVLFLYPEKLFPRELYRLLGDGVFLFPLPYLLWHYC